MKPFSVSVALPNIIVIILTVSLNLSVLGTLAATYLCVAVIIKYYLMDTHKAMVTPEDMQG